MLFVTEICGNHAVQLCRFGTAIAVEEEGVVVNSQSLNKRYLPCFFNCAHCIVIDFLPPTVSLGLLFPVSIVVLSSTVNEWSDNSYSILLCSGGFFLPMCLLANSSNHS